MQSIRLFQQKLWYKSISPHMHYLSTKQTPLKKQKSKNVKEKKSSKRCNIVKTRLYGLKLLRENGQCVYKVHATYQMDSVKALMQVDLPMHALSEH